MQHRQQQRVRGNNASVVVFRRPSTHTCACARVLYRAEMRLLIMSSLTPATGNASTAYRIGSYLTTAGHSVHFFDIALLDDALEDDRNDAAATTAAVRRLVHETLAPSFLPDVDLVIGVHAYRSGRILLHLDRPYVVVLGGTDIFRDHEKKETHLPIMTDALQGAAAVVAFSEEMRRQCEMVWPSLVGRVSVIAPSVSLGCTREEGVACVSAIRTTLSLPKSSSVFLHPTGLRPVKDPLFIVAAFSRWHLAAKLVGVDVVLVVVGGVLGCAYADTFFERVRELPGVFYHPAVDMCTLHGEMTKSVAVVNSSVTEGLSNVILEAIALDVPVAARRNDGNASIIDHDVSGVLFDDAEACITAMQRLLNDVEWRAGLCRNASEKLQKRFDPTNERDEVLRLLECA